MFLLSLLMLFLIGILIIGIFWPKEGAICNLGLKFWLAFGIGSGVTSIMYFFHNLFWGSNFKSVIISEAFLLVILIIILFFKKPKLNILHRKKEDVLPKNALSRIISISFYTTACSSFMAFLIFSLKDPHGNWDAWFIWNIHARFIYRLNSHLIDFFQSCPDWSHPDYPPLISATVARCWQYIGHEQLIQSIIIATLFTFGLVFLLSSSLSVLKNKNQGYLAGMVMLSTFIFIKQGATQCADIPIAFFFLSTIVLLSLKDKFNKNSLLILAGITAGMSAWCKNEGMLFIISIFIARFIAILIEKGFKIAVKELALFFAGLFPVLIWIIYFKTQLAPVNDIFLNQGIGDFISKILTPERYAEIFSQFIIVIKNYFGRLTGLPLLVIYALLIGINVRKEYKTNIITIIITLCLMIMGYVGIYLITPHDLHWHLSTSLYRLLLQLWPCLLLLYFMVIKTPEETLGG
ncbi:MAG: glycosyltransferase family 39 protein [Candidatus Gastranaerophilales bacterium]|nr:glycosyltransferase family 39 protein [Candidatus Gastranaerophilales bacterium]